LGGSDSQVMDLDLEFPWRFSSYGPTAPVARLCALVAKCGIEHFLRVVLTTHDLPEVNRRIECMFDAEFLDVDDAAWPRSLNSRPAPAC
jgi:hypothetical protein